ncbi:MATE family efflux transporter [Glutamicibacter sp.]|uniref:MATE family efflux transporter n=1 Tax=Glutamicibacter sp. TaxID=1931995 RepID=UPI0028BD5E6D|nr:MATE family efflux transporter [Glutamicibacter sp.]
MQRSDRWYLASAPIGRALIHLALPMAAAMVVGAIHNVINAGFLGSQNNTAFIAAVTFGTPILGLMMAIGNVFGVGGGAMISRLLGALEHQSAPSDEIKRVSSFTLWGAVVAGIAFAAIGLLLLQPLVAVVGTTSQAFEATSGYIGVMLAFLPVLAGAMALEQIVRSQGAARQAMIGMCLATLGNLVFDIVFILILHWGTAGAAVALGLGNLGSILYWSCWLNRNSSDVSLSPRWFTLASNVAKPVLSVGFSELLGFVFMILTTLVLNNLAANYGDGPIAAMGVAVRIAQVPEFLIMGITVGILPLLAYAFGKGDSKRLSSGMRASAVAIGAVSLFFFAVILIFCGQIIPVFLPDSSMLTLAVTIVTAQLVAMLANGFTGLITSLFQASGLALPAMLMSVAQGVLFIPIVILGNLLFGLPGIIWSLTTTEVLVLIFAIILWLVSRRRINDELRATAAAEDTLALAVV